MPEISLKLNDAMKMATERHRAGNVAAAHYICRQILAIDPQHAEALRLLGLQPAASNAQSHHKSASTLIEQGRLDEAEAELWRAIEIDSDNPRFQVDFGNLQRLRNMPAKALFIYSQAIKGSPDFAPAYTARAAVLRENMLLDHAMTNHRKAVQLAPLDISAHLEMAKTLGVVGDVAAAKACCDRALEIDPQSGDAWECLGKAMQTNGRFSEAADALRRALKIKPSAVVAQLLGMMIQQTGKNEIDRLAVTFDDAQLSEFERVSADFARGKVLDETDRFDEAFAAYTRANALFKEMSATRGHRFEFSHLKNRVNEIIATFTPAFFHERAGWGNPSQMPVFIVGMPRSGTSLVEQVASSHSQVFGAGERFDIAMMHSRLSLMEHGDSPRHWDESAISNEARTHLNKLSVLGGNAARVIDKMPGNIVELGLIATLFPNARVIFCQRDARDVCLSCFFQLFPKNNHIFSYDLADLGRQFNEYHRLTEHWQAALPLQTLFIRYEELVAELEGQSRRLIEFLGLPWEPRCLEFYKTKRPVLTRSFWQVRQPIYTQSVGRWKKYEKHLAPLTAALAK